MGVVAILLLPSVALAAVLLFAKLVKNPKIALYLAVFTAPLTRSLGAGTFLQRLTVSEIMGMLFVFTWFANGLVSQHRRLRSLTPLGLYGLLLVYILGLSLVVNLVSYYDIVQGVEEFIVILYLVIFYFVFTQAVTTEEDIQKVLDVWLLAAVFVVGIGLWDSIGHRLLGLPQIIGPVKEQDQYRVAATFRTTGQLGVYLLSTFFVALACYFLPDSSRRRRTRLALLMVGIFLLSIFASRRSTYVAFLVGLAAFLIVKVKDPKALIPGLVICAAGFAAIMTLLNKDEDLSRYFQSRISVLTLSAIQSQTFIQLQWQGTLNAFMENPIAGVGIGGFLYSKYDLTTNEIHSTYGQLLAETGVLGLTVYALFMLMLVRLVYDTAFRLKDPQWSVFCGIIFAAFFGFAVSYSYNRHLRERTFWILVGVIACIHRLAKARSRLMQRRRWEATLARKQKAQLVIGAS